MANEETRPSRFNAPDVLFVSSIYVTVVGVVLPLLCLLSDSQPARRGAVYGAFVAALGFVLFWLAIVLNFLREREAGGASRPTSRAEWRYRMVDCGLAFMMSLGPTFALALSALFTVWWVGALIGSGMFAIGLGGLQYLYRPPRIVIPRQHATVQQNEPPRLSPRKTKGIKLLVSGLGLEVGSLCCSLWWYIIDPHSWRASALPGLAIAVVGWIAIFIGAHLTGGLGLRKYPIHGLGFVVLMLGPGIGQVVALAGAPFWAAFVVGVGLMLVGTAVLLVLAMLQTRRQ